MRPTITAFATSPDRGRGLARDMPVRWALEEAGIAYDVRLLSFAEMKEPAHLALQPFAQIPTFEDGDVVLFETCAIVLHVADPSDALLPRGPAARARAISWTSAAVGTIEPPIVERETMLLLERDAPWFADRLPRAEERVTRRLAQLSARLGERDWLEDGFGCGDLMMVSVLRRLGGSDLLATFPNLVAYVARGEARPAFARAFAAQRAVFERTNEGSPSRSSS
ncbi:glutathione S-transferase family protein [Salinarimonas chemoclinalis]|uniref:glutathione S-transferase family protein n=1 Tax=Salinarimonas chemoclinalis TaxID=3241599 RepID=UPI0035563183